MRGFGSPVFVLGLARSGTSIVGLGLTRGAGLPGFQEGHVFPLLGALHENIDAFFAKEGIRAAADDPTGVLIGNLDPAELKDHLTGWFAQFVKRHLGDGVWVDKTPDMPMLKAVGQLAEVYPGAHFIFVKRRGIECLLSRLRKFPQPTFEDHCLAWATGMEYWRKVRGQLPAHRHIEIDQREVALRSRETGRTLGSFLGLTPEQTEGLVHYWQTCRPEQSRWVEEYRAIDLDETGWPKEQRAYFSEVCGPLMEAYGYSLGGQVFREAFRQPVYLFRPVAPLDQLSIRLENLAEDDFLYADRGFLLRAGRSAPGPLCVRYGCVELLGHNRFSATVNVRSAHSKEAEFRMLIAAADGAGLRLEHRLTVSPGKEVLWEFPLPDLEGVYEVLISTRLSADADKRAVVEWTMPHFSHRD